MWGIKCPFCEAVAPLFSDKRGLPYTTCPQCLTRMFFRKPEFLVRHLVRLDTLKVTDKKQRKAWTPTNEHFTISSYIMARQKDLQKAIDFFWTICAKWGVTVTPEMRDEFVESLNRLSPKEIRNPHTLIALISSIVEKQTQEKDDFDQRLAQLEEKVTAADTEYLKIFEEMLHGRIQRSSEGGAERADRKRADKS